MTWPADPTAFCSAPWIDPGSALTVSECGGYHRLEEVSGDGFANYYYDAKTGKLVADVAGLVERSTSCLAGPSGFTEPSCGAGTPVNCVDAGNGAGGSSAGGASNGGGAGSGP